jgi:glycine oxidase
MGHSTADVVVIGAGTIGTAIAWRCAQRGCNVTLADPAPERGAWNTAAGMLAPSSELHYEETALFRLGQASLARYPAFVAELADTTGRDIAFWPCGTLTTAWDAADLAALRDLHTFGRSVGANSHLLTGRELRQLEPALSPGIPGGLLAQDDHQVDPRALHAALRAAAGRAGVRTVSSAARVTVADSRVTGVELADGTRLVAAVVVLAAGAWSAAVEGVPSGCVAPVRPVKGQTVRLRLPGEPRLRHVVRASVKGTPVYLVPRADGRIVVGASSEELGFDLVPRAGAVYELLRDAQTILPELGEAAFEEVCTGLRPGSPDNAPLIGPSGLDGLVHASGHFRNGILLTPITADAIAQLVVTGALPDAVAPFTPSRFQRSEAVRT